MIDKNLLLEIKTEVSRNKISTRNDPPIEYFENKIKMKCQSSTIVFRMGLSLLYRLYRGERFLNKILPRKNSKLYLSSFYLNLIRKLYLIYDT